MVNMKSLMNNALLLVLITIFVSGCEDGSPATGEDDRAEVQRKRLSVGYIPIADHMLVGFAAEKDGEKFKNIELDPLRFTNYPTMSEALRSGDLDGAFLLAPLAFQLRLTGAPVKLVLLGHRDGSGLVVDSSQDIGDIGQLAGETVAIPHRFSTNNFLLHMLSSRAGISEQLDTIEAGPPEMFSALSAGSIGGYITAEPFLTEAENANVGEVLMFTSEIWKGHPDCVLVLSEDYIASNPEGVQELVTSMVKAAVGVEADRAGAAATAARFLGKDERLWLAALGDRRRVTFENLVPVNSELERMQTYMAENMGLFPNLVAMEELVDASFAEKAYAELGLSY